MGFESGFEGMEGWGISDAFWECIPEGKGPVTPGPPPGLGDLEDASIAGPEEA